MRAFALALLVVLLCAAPVQAAAPPLREEAATKLGVADPVPSAAGARLVRYSYAVAWSGAAHGAAPAGRVDVMLQADLKADQQTVFVVRQDGFQVARAVQSGTSAFVTVTGQEMAAVYDLMLGQAAIGFPLGLRTLVDWAQGLDATGPVAIAQVTRGSDGRPRRLIEDGWRVDYTGWTRAQGVDFWVPQRWRVSLEGTPLTLDMTLIEATAFQDGGLPEGYQPIQVR